MVAAEIELKFRVPDVTAFHEAAQMAGFRVLTPRTLERNTLYDTPDRRLRAQRQLLRIRRYGDVYLLTHKKPFDSAREQELGRYKFRREIETVVEDGEALGAVFAELGYAPVFDYEKYRTEFEDGAGKLVLDETPIGIFAEAEGEPEWIDRTLLRLGISLDACFTESYGRLFEAWRAETGSAAQNMTFAEIDA